MTVAIVDYGSGNLHSAAKAFERAAREEGLDQPIVVTSDPERVRHADRVVLPGVGAFADCRRGLDAVPGMVEALNEAAVERGRPFLGICVGMQLMAERGREYEVTPGLGWIAGEVDRIAPTDPSLKIPHMGWNTLNPQRAHPLLDGIATGPDGLHAYFVHSYHLNVDAPRRSGGGGRLRRAGDRHRRARHHGRHAVPPGEEPAARPAADRQFPEVDSRDPVSRHRPQGRAVRAPAAGRHGARDRVPPRSGRAGARLRDAGLRVSAHRRSRRRVCRQADQRRGGRAHPGGDLDPGAARRRHPRHGDDRGLARQGRRPRHHRHRGGARSRTGEATRRAHFPAASRSGSMRATARSRSRAGPRRRS